MADSTSKDDRALAQRIAVFVKEMPVMRRMIAMQSDQQRALPDRGLESRLERVQVPTGQARGGPDIER